MKIKGLQNIALIGFSLLILNSCEIKDPIPLSSKLIGRWEWVRTETPSKTITPETEGYKEDLSISNNGDFDYAVIYREDTLWLSLIETRRIYEESDNKARSVLIPYRNGGFIKYFLKFDQNKIVQEIERTELMDEYSKFADTIRHVYVKTLLPPREHF